MMLSCLSLRKIVNLMNYACFFVCRLCGVVSSFVAVPRITFAGLYRADYPTANNEYSDFAFAAGYGGTFSPRWNPQEVPDEPIDDLMTESQLPPTPETSNTPSESITSEVNRSSYPARAHTA